MNPMLLTLDFFRLNFIRFSLTPTLSVSAPALLYLLLPCSRPDTGEGIRAVKGDFVQDLPTATRVRKYIIISIDSGLVYMGHLLICLSISLGLMSAL